VWMSVLHLGSPEPLHPRAMDSTMMPSAYTSLAGV
jgi:hypothetical protein